MEAGFPCIGRGVFGGGVAGAVVEGCDFIWCTGGVRRCVNQRSRWRVGWDTRVGEDGRERKAESEDAVFCEEIGS